MVKLWMKGDTGKWKGTNITVTECTTEMYVKFPIVCHKVKMKLEVCFNLISCLPFR